MRSLGWMLSVIVGAACSSTSGSPETDTDANPDVDTDWVDTGLGDDGACDAQITMFEPDEAETGVSRTGPYSVWFSAPVPEGRWTMGIQGVTGTSALAEDRLSATFTPTSALASGTSYVIAATACDDSASSSFETISDPLDPTTLVGRTYAFAFDDVEWVEPAAAVATVLEGQITLDYLLTQVTTATSTTLEVSGAVGIDGTSAPEQAACYPAIAYDGVDFSENPRFEAGPSTLSIPTDTFAVTIEQMQLSANFTASADALENIALSGLVDVRPIDVAIGDSSDICELVTFLGDACEACGDGAIKCLAIDVRAETAAWVEGLDIDESYDPSTDLNCN